MTNCDSFFEQNRVKAFFKEIMFKALKKLYLQQSFTMKNITALFLITFFSIHIADAQNQTAKKYLNVELLTNTWCGLCAIYDPPAMVTYQANKKDIHLLGYYPNVPYPNCPFNQANTVDNNARKNYYGVSSTPKTYTLGTMLNQGSSLLTQSFVDSNLGQTSALRVEVVESGPSTGRSVSVNVKSFDVPPTGDIRLFVAAVVENVNFNAQNGLTDHKNVLWQFLSSENGDAFTPAALNGTVNFQYTYDTNNLTHSSFMANEVYTIAFVQEYGSMEVINSGSSKDIIVDATVTGADCGSNNGAIDLSISGGSGSYNIFWSNGMQVEDINNLSPGTYTVVINDGGDAEVESTITVGASSSNLSISGLPPFTSSSSPISLAGSPAGGSFSGTGIIFNAFNPAVAGAGTHTITYTDACGASTSQNILVFTITYNFVNYNLGTIAP